MTERSVGEHSGDGREVESVRPGCVAGLSVAEFDVVQFRKSSEQIGESGRESVGGHCDRFEMGKPGENVVQQDWIRPTVFSTEEKFAEMIRRESFQDRGKR